MEPETFVVEYIHKDEVVTVESHDQDACGAEELDIEQLLG